MVFYFAGNGLKVENDERIMKYPTKNWGVLLSYKDVQTKDEKGSKRFQKLVERKKK